tara:strand:+ start:3351 stop:4604 length:1254 start_codon:yes stop_codon:yes gene_type:complete
MSALKRKKAIQENAKNSIAKKLEKLNSKNKTFLVNVNGFLGDVNVNVPVPIRTNTQIKNKVSKLPIFIISAHGENIGNLHISRNSYTEGIPIIEERRGGHLFETAEDNQWVVHNAPICSLVCPSKYDDPFLNYLTSDPISVKNILFSKHPNRLFKNICFGPTKPTYKTPNFTLPGMPYPRKQYWFYDSPDSENSYDWHMGVYPIFKSHKALSTLYDHEFVFRNTKSHDMENRIFNEKAIEELNWGGHSHLLKKYEKLTKILHNSLPNYDKKTKKWSDGKPISQKTIMDVMGPGIYIALSCSPFINKNEFNTPIDKDVVNSTAEKLIEEVSKTNLKVWGNYYLQKRLSRRINGKYKQEIFVDRKATKSGYKNTGVKLSTKGRIICRKRLYDPDYISPKEESSSSESQSSWSSSSSEED